MFRQIVVPTEKDHQITLPENLYGKQVEVIAFEIEPDFKAGKAKHFLDDIESIPDFPSIEHIRKQAWPEK
jgi:hypothetical protein